MVFLQGNVGRDCGKSVFYPEMHLISVSGIVMLHSKTTRGLLKPIISGLDFFTEGNFGGDGIKSGFNPEMPLISVPGIGLLHSKTTRALSKQVKRVSVSSNSPSSPLPPLAFLLSGERVGGGSGRRRTLTLFDLEGEQIAAHSRD